MPKKYPLLVLLLLLCMPETGMGNERILINTLTNHEKSMPGVVFSHDGHIERLEKDDMDCTQCHISNDDGFSEKFKTVDSIPEKNRAAFMHKNCVQCHLKMKNTSGPNILACRSCHDQTKVDTQSRVQK